MTTTSVTPTVAPAEQVLDGCAVCPHPVAAHDTISLRFCRATEARAGENPARGCVCPSS
jgi:hypothetical protein